MPSRCIGQFERRRRSRSPTVARCAFSYYFTRNRLHGLEKTIFFFITRRVRLR